MTALFGKTKRMITIAFIAAMGACSDDSNNPQPATEYVSAEAYLKEIGFTGSVLIRKGNIDVVRSGFGMADLSHWLSNQIIYSSRNRSP